MTYVCLLLNIEGVNQFYLFFHEDLIYSAATFWLRGRARAFWRRMLAKAKTIFYLLQSKSLCCFAET